MSQTPAATASSSSLRFQAIFQAALKSYQKRTKNDLLSHPLASQLQDCDSTAAILAILHDQVQQFDKSLSGDERLTKWLGPTVNVLNAFSATISGGVSLVCLDSSLNVPSDIYFAGIFTCECHIHGHWCLAFGVYPINALGGSISHRRSYRRPKELQRAKTFSRSFSIGLDGFSLD